MDEFFFIRHGETESNVRGVCLGDVSLNEKGIKQARRAQEVIAALPIQTVCHSPLARAMETAEILTEGMSIERKIIQELTECSSELWEEMMELESNPDATISNELRGFMSSALEGIRVSLIHPAPVLVVAHGGVHWAFCHQYRLSHEWKIGNCIPLHFKKLKDSWEVIEVIK